MERSIEQLQKLIKQYNKIKIYLKKDVRMLQQYEEKFIVQYTYESNAIEGNTCTLRETRDILVKDITPAGKSLREIYEQVNHQNAFKYAVHCIKNQKDLNESIIKDIHQKVMNNIIPGGVYRNISVGITGATHECPMVEQLPFELKQFYDELNNKNIFCGMPESTVAPVELAAWTHAEFVRIHPFRDGNGRTSRLMMNYQLMNYGYVPISIPVEQRQNYYQALDIYCNTRDLQPFVELITELECKELEQLIAIARDIQNSNEQEK